MEDVLGRLVGRSVLFNGLVIPGGSIELALSRYVDNLVIWNDDKTYRVSLVGSAVPVKFANRYFLLCTNHQLKRFRMEKVALLARDGRNLVTSSGVRHFADESSPHYRDLAAFDFSEACEARPEFKERFFHLLDVPPATHGADTVAAVVAGFPTGEQVYELSDKNHIGRSKRAVLCHPHPETYDPALLCLRAREALNFDPDGMSGGSAFVVQIVNGVFKAYFAGMVVTGGRDRFHIVKAKDIYRFLEVLSDR